MRQRILIVEDEAFVALDLEMQLEAAGFTPVGPAPSVDIAMQLIENSEVDFAVLDLNLDGESSIPVARRLESEEVPFVFVSGYDRGYLDDELPDAPLLQKPVRMAQLLDLLKHRHAP